jgi:hypothetical protein
MITSWEHHQHGPPRRSHNLIDAAPAPPCPPSPGFLPLLVQRLLMYSANTTPIIRPRWPLESLTTSLGLGTGSLTGGVWRWEMEGGSGAQRRAWRAIGGRSREASNEEAGDGVHGENYHNILYENNNNKNILYLMHLNTSQQVPILAINLDN